MLRKRSRSVHKDQSKGHQMGDSASDSEKLGQKQKNGSFFSVPGLFVGFNIKGVSDSDSVRSPTSPLDYKVLGNNTRSVPNGSHSHSHKSWDCSKVGLGIIDSLDHASKSSENVVGSSGSTNILFGSQMRMNSPSSPSRLFRSIDSSVAPQSLPKNYTIFPQTKNNSVNSVTAREIEPVGKFKFKSQSQSQSQSHLSDSSRSMSCLTGLAYSNSSSANFWSEEKTKPGVSLGIKGSSLPISIGSGLIGSLSASEIELSEDYTCIISHGPNPRTTHIFGDCVLECHVNELEISNKKEEEEVVESSPKAITGSNSNSSLMYPSENFLSFCHFCKKKLEEGNDIYMYRGEKAFCSSACRDQEMLVEEEMENDSPCNSPKSTCTDDIFFMGV